MSITAPIPQAAWSIVKAIRAEVPRPDPGDFYPPNGHELRQFNSSGRCPMGMLPNATYTPTDPSDFYPRRRFPIGAIESFFEWWDAQIDSESAVNAVWGGEKP